MNGRRGCSTISAAFGAAAYTSGESLRSIGVPSMTQPLSTKEASSPDSVRSLKSRAASVEKYR